MWIRNQKEVINCESEEDAEKIIDEISHVYKAKYNKDITTKRVGDTIYVYSSDSK